MRCLKPLPCHLVFVHRFWQCTVLAQLPLQQYLIPLEAYQCSNYTGCHFWTNSSPAPLPPGKRSKCAIVNDHMLSDVPNYHSVLCHGLAEATVPTPLVSCFGTRCWCLASHQIEQ